MKKVLMIGGAVSSLLFLGVHADPLKNSLSNMIKEKDTTPGMVDLSRIGQKDSTLPSRSAKTAVATINGKKILKREADAHLKKRTKGKIKDFDLLPNDQRLKLIKDMAMPILLLEHANKELPQKEKDAIYARMWMQKKAADIKISDEELKKQYEEMKYKILEQSGMTKAIPSFETLKEKLRRRAVEKQIMDKLLEDVNITTS